mgnify:CR=1 FL=1
MILSFHPTMLTVNIIGWMRTSFGATANHSGCVVRVSFLCSSLLNTLYRGHNRTEEIAEAKG